MSGDSTTPTAPPSPSPRPRTSRTSLPTSVSVPTKGRPSPQPTVTTQQPSLMIQSYSDTPDFLTPMQVLGVILFSFFLGCIAILTFYYYWFRDDQRRRERLVQEFYQYSKKSNKASISKKNCNDTLDLVMNPLTVPPHYERKARSDSSLELLPGNIRPPENMEEGETSEVICL